MGLVWMVAVAAKGHTPRQERARTAAFLQCPCVWVPSCLECNVHIQRWSLLQTPGITTHQLFPELPHRHREVLVTSSVALLYPLRPVNKRLQPQYLQRPHHLSHHLWGWGSTYQCGWGLTVAPLLFFVFCGEFIKAFSSSPRLSFGYHSDFKG